MQIRTTTSPMQNFTTNDIFVVPYSKNECFFKYKFKLKIRSSHCQLEVFTKSVCFTGILKEYDTSCHNLT